MIAINKFTKGLKTINVSPLQKILYIIAMLCGIMLMFGYVLYLMGNDYFLIKSNISITNPFLLYAIPTCLFMLNMFFVFAVSLEIKGKELAKVTLIYFPVYIFSVIFIGKNAISSTLIPTIYVLLISIFKKDILSSMFRYILFAFVTFIFQALIISCKIGALDLGYNYVTYIQVIVYSIDLFIIMGLYYAIKKGFDYVSYSRKLVIASEIIDKNTNDAEDVKAIQELNSLNKSDKIVATAIMFAFQIIQLFIVLLICKIGNVFFESIIILFSFFIIRMILKRCWHSSSLVWCTIISALTFYLGAKLSIPLQYSLFCPIIVGALIAYILYRVALYTDEYKEQKQTINSQDCIINELQEENKEFLALKNTKLSKGMDREILVNSCKLKNLSEQEKELLILKYVDCLPIKNIVAIMDIKYNIARATVYRWLDNSESKFNSII